MPYGNNRAAAHPRATFQTAGGCIIKYRHPYLSGQINGVGTDEVDVSRALKLNETFLDANPAQDNAIMETLVDGSTITITNHLLSGTLSLQVLRTTGLVGTGDFIAALHLVIASKDGLGGTLTVIETIDGKRLVTIFYGVSCKQVPHLKKAGNAVITYPVTLNYAGWVQGVSANLAVNEQHIWAVGNKYGLSGVYKPFAIQEAENDADFYGGKPLPAAVVSKDGTSVYTVGADNADSPSGDREDTAVLPDPGDGVSDTPEPSTHTWET